MPSGSRTEFREEVRGYIGRAENNGPVIAYSENTFLNFILCCHEVVHGRSVQSLVTQILDAVKATGYRVSATKQSEGAASVPSLSPEMQSHPCIKEDSNEQHLPSDTYLNPPSPITDKPALERKLRKLSPEMLIYLIGLGGNPFDDLEKFYLFSDVTTLLGAYPTLSPDMKQYITALSSKPGNVSGDESLRIGQLV